MIQKCMIMFHLLTIAFQCSFAEGLAGELLTENPIVIATKKIELKDFPGAHNPSLVKVDNGFLLTFRYSPEPRRKTWVSYIGIVKLNEALDPISEPQFLLTRSSDSVTESQSEDARIFSIRGKLYVIYNDNLDFTFNPWDSMGLWVELREHRRDMYISELLYENNRFSLSEPIKLVYEDKYLTQLWQKNWVPFEWRGRLLLGYTVNPHEVIFPSLTNGACYLYHQTAQNLNWDWGILRGSTPALLLDGDYLAFFHSSVRSVSTYLDITKYYMGAYTFSHEPPFQLKKISSFPITAESFSTPSQPPFFYISSYYQKRVIFPMGLAIVDSTIYMAYGKDDCEMWIATIDKQALLKSLKPVAE